MRTGIWSGSISFGLVNIPVTLQGAEKEMRVHFNLLDKRDLAPIRYRKINGKTGKNVSGGQIAKGFAYEKGKYVLMSDADLRHADPKATTTLDIQSFVRIEDIDVMYFEKPYYLVPRKGGEKSYHLLHQALAGARKGAIATFVMHTRAHLTCILPRGNYLVLEILRFAHELKRPEDAGYMKGFSAAAQIKPVELKAAEQLVEGMTAEWKPEQYKDTYYQDLMRHIKAKVRAGEGKPVKEPVEAPQGRASRPTDLMALLKKSLEGSGAPQAKKPKGNAPATAHLH